MATTKAKISTVVSKQLPEYVRDDYATLVAFIEAYYDYLDDNYTERNLQDLRDVDNTLDSFIQYFKNEIHCLLDSDFPNCPNLDERHFIKFAKQMYSAKGSEAAYKLLFRLLYNKELDIFYPGSLMLRTSDGKWQQDISFFANVTSAGFEATDIEGKEVTVTESNGDTFTVFVERVVLISGTQYEIFVQRFEGTITVGDGLSLTNGGTFAGTVLGTTSDISIIDAGAGFSIGDILDADDGSTGTGTRIKVTQVSSTTGAIEKVQFVQFGTGYTTDFQIEVAPAGTVGANVSPISVSLNSVEQFEVPSQSYTLGFEESGYITNPDYWALDYSDGTYAGTQLTTFNNTFTAGTNTENIAVIKFTIGSTANYPGYYSSNDGFISDSIFIQDSKFYQAYSYQLRIDELLTDYKNIVKSWIHPAGLNLFGEYQINDVLDLSGEITLSEKQIRVYLSDTTTISESLVWSMSKPLAETPTITESLVYSMSKPLADAPTITEDTTFDMTKVESDSVTITELKGFDFEQELGDTFTLTEGGFGNYNNLYWEAFGEPDYAFDVESRDVGFDYDETPLTDTPSITDALANELNKDTITESFSLTQSGSVLLNPYSEGNYFAGDYVSSESPAATF